MTEQEWKAAYIAHIKARMTGDGWTDEDREKVARLHANAAWPDSDNGEVSPDESADAEADEMARG